MAIGLIATMVIITFKAFTNAAFSLRFQPDRPTDFYARTNETIGMLRIMSTRPSSEPS